jgi:protein TonB|tara:strand:- start:1314 stop:1925 length:612 start_codon:yes stop_codon:yes gene_type:complete
MIKDYLGHIIGLLIALLFFLLLAYIVKPNSESLKTENSFRVVDFIRLKKDTSLREKSRTIPDKPEPPKKPPPPDLVTPELQAPPQAPNLNIDFPDISVPTDFKGAFLGPQNQGGNSQVIPLVRINPQYPRNELLAGVEGWVKVKFTVDADGSVSSPKIMESKPPRVFDTAALRAIMKWKFKPKVVNGVAVPQDGTQVIEFKLF